jgi:serine protease Do
MFRRGFYTIILLFCTGFYCFGQAGALRDYVGLINQTFHPDIVAYLQKFRSEFDKRGDKDAAKSIDEYLKGATGSGFIYVAADGANYIITNHHVISQAHNLSVTFEKQDGAKVKYEDLTIIAADEDMDIALLAFPGGSRPFGSGLAFLDRPVDEGEDVYSAGFPGMGAVTLWQLGRGMVSNARAAFPAGNDDGKIMGPYIQHTAQVDPGNSGGPLLVQTPGVPAGYAVAGINTLSARFRQAANFSIPMDRVRSFLDAALAGPPADERPRLDARVSAFIAGLNVNTAVYEHIADYLSNACTAENAEFAITEVLGKAPRTVRNDIVETFNYSPVEGMNYAVAWTIENSLRTKSGKISISVDNVVSNSKNGFTITFKVNDGIISSEWANEYGIWRINTFGDFVAGDKTLVEKRKQEQQDSERLRSDPDWQVSAGLAYIIDKGPAFGLDIKGRVAYFGGGLRVYTRGADFSQVEGIGGFYIPIRIKKVALTPYADLGLGIIIQEDSDVGIFDPSMKFGLGVSVQGGLIFTTSMVPGLYLQTAYQYNLYFNNDYPHALFFSVGYAF